MIYFIIPIIGLVSMIFAIKIDMRHKKNRRNRNIQSIYDTWDENQNII